MCCATDSFLGANNEHSHPKGPSPSLPTPPEWMYTSTGELRNVSSTSSFHSRPAGGTQSSARTTVEGPQGIGSRRDRVSGDSAMPQSNAYAHGHSFPAGASSLHRIICFSSGYAGWASEREKVTERVGEGGHMQGLFGGGGGFRPRVKDCLW